ncbi:MAG: hypothetical protein AAF074_07010, partial [Pseudomonadota bacterium]
GHNQRPDTRPIEDPAERPKIMLAKQGASTHVMAYEMPLGEGIHRISSPADVLRDLLGWRLMRSGFLSHLHSLMVTMSQKPSFPKSLQMSHAR